MKAGSIIPELEERFLQPPGWQWGEFTNVQEIPVRFAHAAPEGARALVVILPGRAEFIEKYFEMARDLMSRGFAVCVMDWAGQGGSGRISHPTRGDTLDFAVLADDLHALLEAHLPQELKILPKVMLAQSMGANAGLRFLKLFPDVFSCAALCAPMTGIPEVRMPPKLAIVLCGFLSYLTFNGYAFGQKDWDPGERKTSQKFTSDPVRGAVHDAWYEMNRDLRSGGVSFNWVRQALRSCLAVRSPAFARAVKTPILIALAGREQIVDNEQTRKIAALLPRAEIVELPEAAHEILMERDDIREKFLARFHDFVEQYVKR